MISAQSAPPEVQPGKPARRLPAILFAALFVLLGVATIGWFALAVANDSEYGLSAAVYSRDSARAWNVAQRLHTGICHINGPTVHDEAQMPFGGCKASGYGRFGGRAGIAEFTELRWITIQTQPRELPF